ncbi:hypothetical protein CBR_g29401 [Chara braunii]|uniref:Retrotransposon gag domain-containing protein n=1 Tax=Chara braunii TaxID=69332 RepID=A0A388JWP9_CHABU|nr:hypothetical protein CBR_g29401 [Chara braunii]|eukprot:GBG62203.1 hypothetical protein CBR_g29401 [Chara braunii]
MGESVVLPHVQGAPPPRPPQLSPRGCKGDTYVPGASPQRPPQISPPAAKGDWHSQGIGSPPPMEINTRDLPENFRVGVIRKSQESNVMLVRPMLGKVRQVTMKLPPPDYVYGMPRSRDPEGAREVVGYWMEHIPNYRGKPGPDFKAMNAAAVRHYAVCPHHQRDFRRLLPLTLKHSAQCRLNLRPELPSDTDPQHTYGRRTSCRPLEELRITGATSAVPCQTQCHVRVPHQQCHVSNMTGLPGQLANEPIADYKKRFQAQLAQIEAEEQRQLAAKAAQLQADEAAAAEKLRLQTEADAYAQARRKEAQDLLQRHEATSIDRLKFWHFEPNGDKATPKEQHKEFLSKLVMRLLYACNYQRSELERQYQDVTQQHQELATLRRTMQGHKDATRALNARLLDLEQAVPGPAAGASSSAPSSRQLEERVDHVVAMLGDISTFAAPTTISSQLHTLKTEVQQLQLTNVDDNPNMYKMPTFQLDKFDDYTQQDPVLWWEAFTTQLRILPVAKHAYIGALFLNSKGGCQTWLSHLATSHGVDVPDLKDKITWEELTRLWKKRFIIDDAPALAINRLFTMSEGNTATRD